MQTYQFYGMSAAKHHYYTMAVYQENWGLTDQLKSEYQVLVAVDAVDPSDANDLAVIESMIEDEAMFIQT